MKYKNALINKAIKLYGYGEPVDPVEAQEEFFRGYARSHKDYKKNKYDFARFYNQLDGLPESAEVPAKNLLFQEDPAAWLYFERAAVFFFYGRVRPEFLDDFKDILEYTLYVERDDLLQQTMARLTSLAGSADYRSDAEFRSQPVYPSVILACFLADKWLGKEGTSEEIYGYGAGLGIYQPIADHWDDLSELGQDYWSDLCEYHLKGLSLTKADKREYEEFLECGLVPMELVNLIKVRKKLGLDVPSIDHELMHTPMASIPVLPTGYSEKKDLIFRAVQHTAETKELTTREELLQRLSEEGIGEKEVIH
ncbi:hypothetical protein C7T94_14500 [Pedobacter yulinensis]|uniref:Uncharacterized protein n=1 Tax=Pedobacter yulinensis TaxID=2126353 RepID=A0A2T3HMS1_9SPHI|nr:hypothetical protein [Pedobacter yulinensis]PST83726.1 hypothetical protein C7T94_14500 [Pedobacter yulinensis]